LCDFSQSFYIIQAGSRGDIAAGREHEPVEVSHLIEKPACGLGYVFRFTLQKGSSRVDVAHYHYIFREPG
jgi:hypothetical protein